MRNLELSGVQSSVVFVLRCVRFAAVGAASCVLLAAAGCAASATSGGVNDPANPSAPTAAAPGESSVLSNNYAPLPVEGSEPAHEHEDPSVHGGHDHREEGPSEREQMYACPMHPDQRSRQPGTCSKCGMKLEPLRVEAEGHR